MVLPIFGAVPRSTIVLTGKMAGNKKLETIFETKGQRKCQIKAS